MPRAFRQRIAIRKRKLTTTRSTLMRHSFSYRDRLRSSTAEVAMDARYRPPKLIRRSQARSRSPKQTTLSHQCIEPRSTLALALVEASSLARNALVSVKLLAWKSTTAESAQWGREYFSPSL
jgi:hypothetical protein